jgi:phosphatidylglycerophosphate synthase
MSLSAGEIGVAPSRETVGSSPLLWDAGFYLALFGAALTAAVPMALNAAVLEWRGAAATTLCYGIVILLVLRGLMRYPHAGRFGLANGITLARASLTSLLFGLAGGYALGGPALAGEIRWIAGALAVITLVLDGLDGYAARRGGTASAFGAHFDMEADALFILALSALVMATAAAGPWILVSGSLRYAFVGFGKLEPRFRAPLPPLMRRKAIYVVQALAPIAALTPLCPSGLGAALCGLAFALVLYSFGADCVWLWCSARPIGRQASISHWRSLPFMAGRSSASTLR